MNIVLGSAFLLLTGIFYILVSGEKGNQEAKRCQDEFNGGEENMAGSFRNG